MNLSKRNFKFLPHYFLRHGAIVFLIIFSTIQFFLILRHKSPYLSDSFFYKHIYYQFQGQTFDQAYETILSQVEVDKVDIITKNFLVDKQKYKNSLTFFTKRPLYPFMTYLLSLIIHNDYWNFMFPVFLGYLGTVILSYKLFAIRFSHFYTILATTLLVSFYPLLDWSTYFLTDSIGASLWLFQVLFAYYYVASNKMSAAVIYSLVLAFSLFNREQNLLLIAMFFILSVHAFSSKIKKKIQKRIILLLAISVFFVVAYIIVSQLLNLRTLYDTIVYTQNSYGLYTNNYSLRETLIYIGHSVWRAHMAFLKDLSQHHWWFTVTVFGIAGVSLIWRRKQKDLVDLFFLSSGIASYLAIFLYPVLSYRFFFPTVVSVIYFAIRFIENFFIMRQKYLHV